MKSLFRPSSVLIALTLLFFSCSRLTKALKSSDPKYKYEIAKRFYDRKDWFRAATIFEDLRPMVTGTALSEEVEFHYADCHHHQKDYLLAAHYFKQFHDRFRFSEYAQQALFMHAYSLYLATPVYNLDQSGTDDAINAAQDFLNRYPESQYAERASGIIDALRRRLEKKAYEIAKLYQKLRRYKSAVIAYENFQKDFPDSDYREEIIFRKLQSDYKLADLSAYQFKKERYEQTFEDYRYFIRRYPESKYEKQAQKVYLKTQEEYEAFVKREQRYRAAGTTSEDAEKAEDKERKKQKRKNRKKEKQAEKNASDED